MKKIENIDPSTTWKFTCMIKAVSILPGREGVGGRGKEVGEEMAQTLYAHMNKQKNIYKQNKYPDFRNLENILKSNSNNNSNNMSVIVQAFSDHKCNAVEK
jgi:hypothetical protein